MPVNPKTLRIAFRALLVCAAGLLLIALPARAETYLSGTYRCVKIEVAGKAAHCSAPYLELKSDGSYQILSEHGTYELVAGTLAGSVDIQESWQGPPGRQQGNHLRIRLWR